MEDRMDATEMRMLRHIYGISHEDHVENTDIRRQGGVSSNMRKRRLQWHGHVCRRDEDEDIRQVTNIQVGGRRKRGRPRQRWKDTVKSDMSCWGLEQEDVHDRTIWHSLIELVASRTATQ